jgi:hypothetical protein
MPGEFEDLTDFGDIEGTFAILESVAQKYPDDSIEYKSIELAARALAFVFESKVSEAFRSYILSSNEPLTDKQKEHLKSMGIEPDEFEGHNLIP